MKSICYTSLRQAIKFILAALILIVLAVGIFLWMLTIKPNIYDKNRKSGIPEALPEEFGYTFYQAQDICDVWICGNPYFDGKNVDFYVTNPTTNEGIAIRAEIYTVAFTRDENGNITYTGNNNDSGFMRVEKEGSNSLMTTSYSTVDENGTQKLKNGNICFWYFVTVNLR